MLILGKDLKTRRNLGTGIEHDGLYYLTNDPSPSPYALSMMNSLATDELLLMHYRLGHLSFQALSRMFPSQAKNSRKDKLLCDVCELAKHTRTNYPSTNDRSKIPFDVVHSDVWGPSVVTALTGDRYYVTFIDGFSRCTWLYLLKHKSEVLPAFKDFFNMVRNQYGMNVKILRSDNGTEYVNGEFSNFLSTYGIIHQTTCVSTAEQNGVAERKNRHLLEVARALMFMMNVPKFLWGEAVKTAAYLINRMPSRVLGHKTPIECLHGSNSFIVPPKIFGCTCFVHDYRSSAGKLDPRAVKCIFVGYSPTKKGYRCWSPAERKFFVSMDVTFHEKEPFYPLKENYRDTCSKGENLIKENNDGGTVMVPIGDIIRSTGETEGEKIMNTNEEGDNELIPEVYENISGQEEMETYDGEGVPQDVNEGVVNRLQVLEETPTSEEIAHDEGATEGDDSQGIEKVKQHLKNEFEVKDLGEMRYFLGIEVSRSPRGKTNDGVL
ncbi:retrovirus-related Pol polyprotein from transposon TNT 1-94 isoform X2 [Lolium perenne]|uniref:retrovirus-related Pol polyprotein from transposon TNT 1-94 isoform X2 n=1 Tax=Lolium perenne TaxID=4522 RepID=UPI003A9A3228